MLAGEKFTLSLHSLDNLSMNCTAFLSENKDQLLSRDTGTELLNSYLEKTDSIFAKGEIICMFNYHKYAALKIFHFFNRFLRGLVKLPI